VEKEKEYLIEEVKKLKDRCAEYKKQVKEN
jgi:DNA-dependent RNA polymerase auxiliary subunit epsilon